MLEKFLPVTLMPKGSCWNHSYMPDGSVALLSQLNGSNNSNLNIFQNIFTEIVFSLEAQRWDFSFRITCLKEESGKTTTFFAAVHYIAAGMTNTTSLEFNIGKMRMQLP